MARENRINQRRFPQSRLSYNRATQSASFSHVSTFGRARNGSGLTDDDYVELEASLEEFVLNLMGDRIESNTAFAVRLAGERSEN